MRPSTRTCLFPRSRRRPPRLWRRSLSVLCRPGSVPVVRVQASLLGTPLITLLIPLKSSKMDTLSGAVLSAIALARRFQFHHQIHILQTHHSHVTVILSLRQKPASPFRTQSWTLLEFCGIPYLGRCLMRDIRNQLRSDSSQWLYASLMVLSLMAVR